MKRIFQSRWLIGIAIVAAVTMPLAMLVGPSLHSTPKAVGAPALQDEGANANVVRVSTLHPKKDAAFVVSIQQFASVRAYFMVDLKTRVAGVVRSVKTDIGGYVKKGEVLVEIDVPDMDKEVLQKRATVSHRHEEMRLAQAKLKSAQAFVEIANANVAQQKASVIQATANTNFLKQRLDRYRAGNKENFITDSIVDEQAKEWQASVGSLEFAKASVAKAEADVKEKEATMETAQVDIDLKKSQIAVAQHDLERSQALADYAKIVAPFDGIITKRNVDPGHFVQNASSGNSEALLTLARIDIVTAVAKVPDNAAPFIGSTTPVEVQVAQLPGANLKAKVTRLSPSIDNSDRTMRVEVDLINAKEICPDDLRLGTRDSLKDSEALEGKRLLPGMNGTMYIKLNQFDNAYLVPSSAVFIRGGKPYVALADKGQTHMAQVAVQVNDGKLAKIALIKRDAAGRETLVELTGREEIVASRQAELDEGQAIQANLQDW
jgi:multidrug resistance efflux pump